MTLRSRHLGLLPHGGTVICLTVFTLLASSSNHLIWTRVETAGQQPEPAVAPLIEYNSTSNRLLRIAESAVPGSPLSTWILTNANGEGGVSQWQQLVTKGITPSGRSGAITAYDERSNQLLLFGGCSQSCTTYYDDAWVLIDADGSLGLSRWIPLHPKGIAPSPRARSYGVYDHTTRSLLLFGGYAGITPQSDVWVLTNADGNGQSEWRELVTVNKTLAAGMVGVICHRFPTSEYNVVVAPSIAGLAKGLVLVDDDQIDWSSTSTLTSRFETLEDPLLGDYLQQLSITNKTFGVADCGSLSIATANLSGLVNWCQALGENMPGIRNRAGGAYDPLSHRLIVHGGTEAGSVENDIWVVTNTKHLNLP